MYEKTLNSRVVYDGRVVTLRVLDVETETGLRAMREVVGHGGAAAVLAQVPDGRFVLVRQFRKAVESMLTEIVAGLLNEGEDPAECARRELAEETGYRAVSIRKVGSVYPSPGYVTEKIDIFFARVADGPGQTMRDEDERLEVVLHSREEIDELIRRGEIQDGKTLAAWLLCEKIPGSGEGDTP
ncbi:MAG: NUDIX hydrolase [Kiritimatiellae bacterium]|nr:NUDIX hydrolase [Kiritimatiellia bacterium]